MFKQNQIMTKTIVLCLVIALITAALAGCGTQKANTGPSAAPPQTRTIVDHAGRNVTVPSEINKVFSTSPVGMILMYTLAPEKLVAWSFEIGQEYKKFILPECRDLPDLGGWYANKSCNTEELLKIGPDIIICLGDQTQVSQAERIQQQLNIPVVVVNSDINSMDKVYEFMGDLLGTKERAAELAAYCRESVDEVAEKAKLIPEEKRVRVYYAEGTQGLDTDPKGSQHTEVLDLVGGINVADVPMKGGMGMTSVSLEQVLSWDPDLILTATLGGQGGQEGALYKTITTDPKWAKLKALKNHKVYDIPERPFNWFDRPPSVNRIIGVKWLANLLYPDIFEYNIKAEMKEFYAKFYHYNLSDQDIEDLLIRSKA